MHGQQNTKNKDNCWSLCFKRCLVLDKLCTIGDIIKNYKMLRQLDIPTHPYLIS